MTRYLPMRRRFRKAAILVAAVLGTVLVLAPRFARAEVVVEGNAESMRLEAKRATIVQILAALRTEFGIRYRAGIADTRPVTGDFVGSLDQVVARVLDDYDYVVKRSPDVVEIVLVSQRKPVDVADTGEPKPTPVVRAPIVTAPPPGTRPPRPPSGAARNGVADQNDQLARRRARQINGQRPNPVLAQPRARRP